MSRSSVAGVLDAPRSARSGGARLASALRWRSLRRIVDREAVRDILPVTVSVMPFAAVIGVTIAHVDEVPVWLGLLSGPLFYGGSAQLATLTMLDAGAGITTVLATVVVMNARLSMYGAALEPRFRDQPAWFRWLGPQSLVDQTFALSDARPELAGAHFRRYWLTIGTVLLLGWMAAMWAAIGLASVLPAHSPLDFASTAVFVGLLTPRLRTRRARPPALVAAIVAVLASSLPYGLGMLAGVVAGVTAGVVQDLVEERRQP